MRASRSSGAKREDKVKTKRQPIQVRHSSFISISFAKERLPALSGKRAFEHYLLCFQLVLWKQVYWLLHVKNLPAEFEVCYRALAPPPALLLTVLVIGARPVGTTSTDFAIAREL